jgi:hypothetical protein
VSPDPHRDVHGMRWRRARQQRPGWTVPAVLRPSCGAAGTPEAGARAPGPRGDSGPEPCRSRQAMPADLAHLFPFIPPDLRTEPGPGSAQAQPASQHEACHLLLLLVMVMTRPMGTSPGEMRWTHGTPAVARNATIFGAGPGPCPPVRRACPPAPSPAPRRDPRPAPGRVRAEKRNRTPAFLAPAAFARIFTSRNKT